MPFGGACDLRSNRSILPTTRQPLPRRPPAAATPHYTAICRRQTAAVCGTTAGACDLRSNRSILPTTRQPLPRRPPAAATPHYTAICRRQTAAVCGTTAIDVHMCTAHSCPLRHHRNRQPPTTDVQTSAAAPPHWAAICRRQTAAVCGTTATDDHTYVVDGRTSRHHRTVQPSTDDKQLQSAAAICRRQTAAVCGTTATDDHTYVVDGRTSRHHRTVQPSTDDKQLQSAAPPRSAATYSRQTDIHRGTAATDSHPHSPIRCETPIAHLWNKPPPH